MARFGWGSDSCLTLCLLTCVRSSFHIFIGRKGFIHGVVAIVFQLFAILALEMRKNNLENVASNDLLFSLFIRDIRFTTGVF